ncbi:MAG: hypothetical protein H6697_03000 [Myxococcales bacterium]|nr:hypothetical protein [Myxococcales bacterium]MCB9520698.1 hypothetical protein [Myxococcales bacterium]
MRPSVRALVLATFALAACDRSCTGFGTQDVERTAAEASRTAAPHVAGAVVAAEPPALPVGLAAYAWVDVQPLLTYAAATAGTTVADRRESLRDQLRLALRRGPSADLADRVKLDAIGAIALGVATDGAWVAALPSGAIDPPLASDAAPVELGSDVQLVSRGGTLYVGQGSALAAALAPNTTSVVPNEWTEAWASLPADSAIVVSLPASTALPESSGISRALLGISAGGEIRAVIGAADATLPGRWLGHVQSVVAEKVAAGRATAPAAARPWVELAARAVDALWSRVTVVEGHGLSTVSIAPPTCGTQLGYALSFGALIGLAADELGSGPGDRVFAPVAAELGEGCVTIPGPVPALPTRFVGLPGGDTTGESALVVADIGGLLRENLPTLFHLLPFSLPADAVAAAVGDAPLGLAGLGDPDGVAGLYIAGQEPIPAVVLSLPTGLAASLPIPTPAGVVREQRDGMGTVFTTPNAHALLDRTAPDGSPWAALVAAAGPRAVVGAFATRAAILTASDGAAADVSALQRADMVGLVLNADLGLSVLLYVPGAASEAAASTPAEIAAAFSDAAGGDASLMPDLTRMVVAEAVGSDIVRIRLGANPQMSRQLFGVGVAAGVGFALIGRISQQLPVPAPPAVRPLTPVAPSQAGQPSQAPSPNGKPPRQ